MYSKVTLLIRYFYNYYLYKNNDKLAAHMLMREYLNISLYMNKFKQKYLYSGLYI